MLEVGRFLKLVDEKKKKKDEQELVDQEVWGMENLDTYIANKEGGI